MKKDSEKKYLVTEDLEPAINEVDELEEDIKKHFHRLAFMTAVFFVGLGLGVYLGASMVVVP